MLIKKAFVFLKSMGLPHIDYSICPRRVNLNRQNTNRIRSDQYIKKPFSLSKGKQVKVNNDGH